MRLDGNAVYLHLRGDLNERRWYVSFHHSSDQLLGAWTARSRTSKLYSLDSATLPDLATKQKVVLYFVGPLDPARLEVGVPRFLSLGMYNVVLVGLDQTHIDEIERYLAARNQLPWESWSIEGGTLVEIRYAECVASPLSSCAPMLGSIPAHHGSIGSANEENKLLLLTAVAKSSLYSKKDSEELQLFSTAFREKLGEEDYSNGAMTKLNWLINVNAHLSRYVTQSFGGTSPIIANECPHSAHSLLGIGIASKALVNVRRFAQSALGDDDFIERFRHLRNISFSSFKNAVASPRVRLHLNAAIDTGYWDKVTKLVSEVADKPHRAADSRDYRLPLVTCFSGRDGFRSTHFSLTAPLELIAGCNSMAWNPMTLSHEICHVWVKGVLTSLFADIDTEPLSTLLGGKREPLNLFEDLQYATFAALYLLDRGYVSPHSNGAAPLASTGQLLERASPQLNEILTHILDFRLFYFCDEVRYLGAIWASWDVIPNIQDRLPDYIVRSTCALLSERLNHANQPWKTALETVKTILSALSGSMKITGSQSNYLDEAISIIEVELSNFDVTIEGSLAFKVFNLAPLVRLAKTFFADTELASRLQHEHAEPGKPYASHSPLDFQAGSIANPLRFALHFCNDRNSDDRKSLWVLHRMAFADC